ATVFRRFPTKDSLIAAVVCKRIDALAAYATAALERPDAGEAFREFVWHAGETFVADRALWDGLGCVEPHVGESKAELNALVQQRITRARERGAVGADVGGEDVSLLVGPAIQATRQSAAPDAWRRSLAVVLDGLRPPA